MAIRTRSILKNWFRRGKYPTEEQFADWADSFFHLEEDTLPLSAVEGLAERLNGKYDKAQGEAAAALAQELAAELGQHEKSASSQFAALAEDIDGLYTQAEALAERVAQLKECRCRDFLNLTARCGASLEGIALGEAIALVPEEDRIAGQVITFVGEDGTWQTYQFAGASTDSYADTSAWKRFGTGGYSSITLNMSDLDFAEADTEAKGVDIETVPDGLPWSAELEEEK